MLSPTSTVDIMHTNVPGPRFNVPRTSDRSTTAGTAAPTAQGAAGTPENAGASKAAQNTPQRSARPNNLMRTSIMNTLRKDPYHAEWQAWAETRDQEAGENRPEAVKRMKACLSKPNRKNKQQFLRLEGLGLNKQLCLHLEGLGLTSLPKTLPAGITSLFASNNRLTSLPQNLPASLRYVQLDNNQFITPPTLPDHVFLLRSQEPVCATKTHSVPETRQQPIPVSDPGIQDLTQQPPFRDAQAARETEEAEFEKFMPWLLREADEAEFEKFMQWLLPPSSPTSEGASNTSSPEETRQQPPSDSDPRNQYLTRQAAFLDAQSRVYEKVLDELSHGRWDSHWMPFIFPQFVGSENGQMGQQFAISNTREARAYLAHPLLGPRLRECTEIVTRLEVPTITDVFGSPDVEKFQASMTMFNVATGQGSGELFERCLQTHFNTEPHRPTLLAMINDALAARKSKEAELVTLVDELSPSLVHGVSTDPLSTSEGASHTSSSEETRQQPTSDSDPRNQYLTRQAAFIDAQNPVYEKVLDELSHGRWNSHWMPFIFPQLVGPENSQMEQQFAISNIREARAYLAHPLLGPRLRQCTEIVTRLRQCTELVTRLEGPTITDVFGSPDVEKFQASMTMFNVAAREGSGDLFERCLKTHFNTEPHRPTLLAMISDIP